MAKLDLKKLDTKSNIALTRRGRLEEGGPGGQVASGYGLGMAGIVSEAAGEAASTGLVPVANPQVMRGMRLDQRSMGGQTFSDLEEDIASSSNQSPSGLPSTKQGDAGNSYKGDASSAQGVYGTGTGTADHYASGRDAKGNFKDDGSIAMARSGDLASGTMGRIAKGALLKGGAAYAGMSLAGMKGAGIAGAGAGFGSMLGFGVFGALNQIGGAIVGSGIGDSVSGEATTDSEKAAREAARKAATGSFGALGMVARGVGSLFGLNKSPYESAEEAYDSSTAVSDAKVSGEQWAQGMDTTQEKTGFAGIRESISNSISGAFGVPDVVKPENQNMSTYGDKGVLEKTSPQQKAIADKKKVTTPTGDKGGSDVDTARGGYTDVYGNQRYDNWSFAGRSGGGGWGDGNSTSEGGFSGMGSGQGGGGMSTSG